MRQLMLLFGTEGNRIRFSDPRSYCRNKIEFPLHTQRMGIFKALGLGIAIVVLKLLMPEVFSGLEGALVAVFGLVQTMMSNMQYNLSA